MLLHGLSIDRFSVAMTMAVVVLALASSAFVHWLLNRRETSMLWIALAGFTVTGAILILAVQPFLPKYLTVGLGNAMAIGPFGLLWAAIRSFDGKRVFAPVVLAPPALWLLACLIPDIYDHASHRVALHMMISAGLLVLVAVQVAQNCGPGERLRRILLGLTIFQTLALATRAIFAWLWPGKVTVTGGLPNALVPMALEGLGYIFLVAASFTGLVHERAQRAQLHVANTDFLTGLPNRRHFLAQAEALVPTGFGLLLFDLDFFKSVNDRFGHAMGDAFLAEFARVAADILGKRAIFGRLGGEEFAALLPAADAEEAMAAAEAVRAAITITALATPAAGGMAAAEARTTVSVGVCVSPPGAALKRAMEAADRALYAAKRAGRNTVVLDSTPDPVFGEPSSPARLRVVR